MQKIFMDCLKENKTFTIKTGGTYAATSTKYLDINGNKSSKVTWSINGEQLLCIESIVPGNWRINRTSPYKSYIFIPKEPSKFVWEVICQ